MPDPAIPPPKIPVPSPMEGIKTASRHLRGTIAGELETEVDQFSKDASSILKFHGIYQQHDRDVRKAESKKIFRCMVRVSIPGGSIGPEQYLALDSLADSAGDGTLRITSRGGIQYHYVGKRNLRSLLRAIRAANLSTFAACGDVVRNIVCPAEPFETGERTSLLELARLLNRELKPRTEAYAEIWIEGEKAASVEAVEQPLPDGGTEAAEPLYGEAYLPRKFKFGFAYEGDNTTDVYSNDVGLVAHFHAGELQGFTMLAGGGMGQTNGIKDSFPRVADVVGFIQPQDLLPVAKAAVTIHRDFGNRSHRKLARLKYVLEERGVDWFRAELETRCGKPLAPPRPLHWTRHSDYLGWHRQSSDKWFFGLRVVSGRIHKEVRAAIRDIVERLRPQVRFTPQQNVLFTDLREEHKPVLIAILRAHGVSLPSEMPPVLRHSMACPALPTCGLALSDSERILPDIVEEVQAELNASGLANDVVHLRMTGCPNGCARPYTAEIGIVGQSPNLYSLYLGGSPMATRIGALYSHNIKRERIAETLRPIFSRYATERETSESFGDFCHRVGIEALRPREAVAAI